MKFFKEKLFKMRITGGVLKGRRIKTRKGNFTRPLLSRIRKSLFDVIGERIRGSKFLDLYAGSGAVGIEALSRGAKEVIFVEKDNSALRILKENITLCGLFSLSRVYEKDVLKFLPVLLREEKFDFIFVAPPYYKGMQNQTLDILEEEKIEGATVIVQHSPKEKINFNRRNMSLVKQKKYGDTILTFLEV